MNVKLSTIPMISTLENQLWTTPRVFLKRHYKESMELMTGIKRKQTVITPMVRFAIRPPTICRNFTKARLLLKAEMRQQEKLSLKNFWNQSPLFCIAVFHVHSWHVHLGLL